MFNIGGSEMIVLLVLGLLVFGAEGLPELIKTVARTVKAFNKAVHETKSEFHQTLSLESQKRVVESRRRKRSLRARQSLEEAPDAKSSCEPDLVATVHGGSSGGRFG